MSMHFLTNEFVLNLFTAVANKFKKPGCMLNKSKLIIVTEYNRFIEYLTILFKEVESNFIHNFS